MKEDLVQRGCRGRVRIRAEGLETNAFSGRTRGVHAPSLTTKLGILSIKPRPKRHYLRFEHRVQEDLVQRGYGGRVRIHAEGIETTVLNKRTRVVQAPLEIQEPHTDSVIEAVRTSSTREGSSPVTPKNSWASELEGPRVVPTYPNYKSRDKQF